MAMATVCVNLQRYEKKRSLPSLRQIHNILRDTGIKRFLYRDLQNIKCSGHTVTELVCDLINGREDQLGTSSWFKPSPTGREFVDTTTRKWKDSVPRHWRLSKRRFCRLNSSEMLRHVDWQIVPTFRSIVVSSSSGPQRPNARPWSWRH